jgi:hypothetical protein
MRLPAQIGSKSWSQSDSEITAEHLQIDSAITVRIMSTEDHKISYIRETVVPKIKFLRGEGFMDGDHPGVLCVEVWSDTGEGLCRSKTDGLTGQVNVKRSHEEYCLLANATRSHHEIEIECEFAAASVNAKWEFVREELVHGGNATNSSGWWGKMSPVTKGFGISIVTIILIAAGVTVAAIVLRRCASKEKIF